MRRRTYVAAVGASLSGGCLGLGRREEQETGPGTETATGTGTPSSGGSERVGFERQWTTELGIDALDGAHVSTVAWNDTVYTTHDRGMTALSLADGDERWANPSTRTFDALAADDDGLYAVWTTGEVLAVDPDTGEARWERGDVGDENTVYGPVVTTADHVAANGSAGVVVHEKSGGERIATLGESARLLAAHDGGFLVDSRAGLARYEPDGTVGWRLEDTPSGFTVGAAVGEGTPVVAGERSVAAVDPADGTKRWERRVETDFNASVTTAGGVALVSERFDPTTVSAFEIDSGARLWTENRDGEVPFPTVGLDSAVVVEDDEQAQARDLRTGEVIDSFETGFKRFIMGTAGRGRTFVGVGRTVYCYQV
ncbi:Outer membrane protein assembly factor BamB, contains PQQ-like beta-propeller repeat [Halorientalis persicus]|uniref:Outer membrane protein assembly factor BamB, contains PQQ-like beta-propeller repeat n=1 Tax=Halorientalis persicus TaxID=1367881 RepID=A0A1H8IWE7_9EURY|nr:PQQ-binding-like beta-propeller repeat protein [Halorientalis persicus]SEN72679.1 Outer membrane protein assembly factor BamB, contains PQQ-like beta-propeller repeat [Halorientalis persicus]